MASKKHIIDIEECVGWIILAIIVAFVVVGIAVNIARPSKDDRHCEESYAYGQYNERCWDDQIELSDKYAEEWDEYQKQQQADEDSYWADKYQEQQYDY